MTDLWGLENFDIKYQRFLDLFKLNAGKAGCGPV